MSAEVGKQGYSQGDNVTAIIQQIVHRPPHLTPLQKRFLIYLLSAAFHRS